MSETWNDHDLVQPSAASAWHDAGIDVDESYPAIIESISPHELGVLGETLALSYLEYRGYEVLQHGYRCIEGEADLVAYDRAADMLVLIEVKSRRARKDDEDLFPEESVDAAKRNRYRRIASCYLMDHFPVQAIRFDVIAITFKRGQRARIEHIHDAFEWGAE